MIKGKVRTLDAASLLRELEDATAEAMDQAGEEIVGQHRSAIQTSQSPTGGSQKRNAPGVRAAKGGRPPLYDTGRLLHGTQARRRGRRVVVEPPSDRRDVVESLHERGFKTIWDADEDDFTPTVQREVSKATRAIDVRDHTREEVFE